MGKLRVGGLALCARAIALDDSGRLVLMARVRRGRGRYLTFVGGHVEERDDDVEAALRREVLEELGASCGPCRAVGDLVVTVGSERRREIFFAVRIGDVDLARASGPEWRRDDDANRYEVVTREIGPGLVAERLLPEQIARRLERDGDPRRWETVEVSLR